MSSYDPPPSLPDPSNPYAAPLSGETADAAPHFEIDQLEAEAIRTAHLGHEASVKSVGSLHFLGACFCLFVIFVGLADLAKAQTTGERVSAIMAIGFLTGIIVMHVGLGFGLRRLRPWARWTEAVLTGLSMAATLFAVTMILGLAPVYLAYRYLIGGAVLLLFQVYILFLLLSRRGAMVFSPLYGEIVARTPYIRYRLSVIVKLGLVLVVAFLTLGVVAVVVDRL